MKYVGIYWALFAPMMKKSITKRFGRGLAEQSISQGRAEYRRLLSHANELGPGNPMASNAYFAYVFAAAWLGSGRRITPEEMGVVMTDVLESRLLRTVFGMTDLNRTPKKWEKDMRKYEKWYKAHGKEYPVNWVVNFDEAAHRDGGYYYFTRCPICEFCQREGIAELISLLVPHTALAAGIGTMFLSFGNAFMFGGMLAALPGQDAFDDFRITLAKK